MGDVTATEWTVVPKKSKRSNKPAKPKALPKKELPQQSPGTDTSASDSSTKEQPSDTEIKELKEEIQKSLARWRGTTCRDALILEILRRLRKPLDVESNLESKTVTPDNFRIDTALCVGLGSFTSIADHRRSIWQLCLFLDVVDTLQTQYNANHTAAASESATPIFYKMASEPLMTALDEAVLSSFGFEVVNPLTDKGEDRIHAAMESPNVFLFAPYLPWFTLYPCIFSVGHFSAEHLVVHQPRLYIGTSIDDTLSFLEGIAKKPKQKKYGSRTFLT